MEDADRGRGSSSRQHSGGGSGSNNYDGQPYHTPMSYQSDYSPDPQSRQPSYTAAAAAAAYTSNVLYNPNQYGYNAAPVRHSHPPSAAIEVLASQFSATPQYYTAGNDSPVAGSVTPHHHQQHASQSQFSSPTSYSQYSSAAQRPPLQYGHQTPEVHHQHISSHAHPDSSVIDDHQHPDNYSERDDDENHLNASYDHYQAQLRGVFLAMNDGILVQAGDVLLHMSRWLIEHCTDLGLVRDDEGLYADRIKLWNEFNTCWLSVLRKEKEMLREYIATGHEPQLPQELLTEDFLDHMGREIVTLCDGIEQHGLVDYQMGVWEEEIIESLTECLDLWETINPHRRSQTSGP